MAPTMPDDLSLIDQLEEWLESQVPANLHELPYKMLETMERVSNELFETLNIHGPPSISIPFPPFLGKDTPPPPPPPPPMPVSSALIEKADKYAKAHPYLTTGGAVLAVTVGLGVGGAMMGYTFKGYGRALDIRRKRFGTRGLIEDGMLKEAIVLLCPSPMPPLLIPLAASLLKAGYIVLVAVPQVKDAESVERRLNGLEEKSGLRVLIYNPEDSTTFPPFHRSLLATLTLRFPASGRGSTGDPYNPKPTHIPRIHAFVSLYPLNPSPPSQPSALPALPTLLAANDGKSAGPMLITLYPSTSLLPTPDTFASQLLTSNHKLLGRNLAASSSASRIISIYIGDITLPSLPAIMSEGKLLSRRERTKLQLKQTASPTARLSIIKDYCFGSLKSLFSALTSRLDLFPASRSYPQVERRFLRILKSNFGSHYTLGQYSNLSLFLAKLKLPPFVLPRILSILPALPASTGPTLKFDSSSIHSDQLNVRTSHQSLGSRQSISASASVSAAGSTENSDHEEDLVSSVHTDTGVSSSSGEGSGLGLDGSWVGLEAGN